MSKRPKQHVASIVGANMARLRQAKGWSQIEFAQQLGIGPDSVSRFENGVVAPRFERLRKIADLLGCRVAELFLENGEVVKVPALSSTTSEPLSPEAEVVALAQRIIELTNQRS